MHITKMTICYLKQITHLSNLSINTANKEFKVLAVYFKLKIL